MFTGLIATGLSTYIVSSGISLSGYIVTCFFNGHWYDTYSKYTVPSIYMMKTYRGKGVYNTNYYVKGRWSDQQTRMNKTAVYREVPAKSCKFKKK